MSKKPERKNLGRGLSALLADVNLDTSGTEEAPATPAAEASVPIEKVHANPDQPRRQFSEEDLQDLTNSVAERGVIQPLIVRPYPGNEGEYQIVAGERRWRASQRAQLHTVPVIIREMDDQEVLEVAIIENIQRADLNAVEEAAGYRQLMERFGHTQEQLATALGKSRSHIANLMRLLNLPEEVLVFLREGKLSAGHARTLVTAEDPVGLARLIMSKGLSVRQAEQLAKSGVKPKVEKRVLKPAKDADTKALERDLSAHLRANVSIDHNARTQGGTVTIRYKDLEELDSLCQVLTGGED